MVVLLLKAAVVVAADAEVAVVGSCSGAGTVEGVFLLFNRALRTILFYPFILVGCALCCHSWYRYLLNHELSRHLMTPGLLARQLSCR
jgi:hypothetical protein